MPNLCAINTLHISALPISIEDFFSVLIFFAG
jgi:hypothetical protein